MAGPNLVFVLGILKCEDEDLANDVYICSLVLHRKFAKKIGTVNECRHILAMLTVWFDFS